MVGWNRRAGYQMTPMSNPKLTPLNLYKITPKTNCGQCFLPSCLAFCAAVVAGQKTFADCPHLRQEDIASLGPIIQNRDNRDSVLPEFLEKLEKKVADIDFQRAAPILGCTSEQSNQLNVNSLGKKFTVDKQGKIHSECHIISWIQAPILSYVTHPTHMDITGNWISFRELKGGIDWQGLFTSRCEKPLRSLADANPDLLTDLIDLFMGKETNWYEADIALILHPLPHIPILICYQAADEDLGSELTIFFDECCGANLHIKSIYTLCAGLVKMFEQIAASHHNS